MSCPPLVYVCLHVSPEVSLGSCIRNCPPGFLLVGTCCPVNSGDPPVSTSLALRLEAWTTALSFYVGSGDSTRVLIPTQYFTS